MTLGWYALKLTVVALAGIAVHESCHYVAARVQGTSAKPSYAWSGYLPNPCIQVELQEHTPRSFRLTVLAPLAVFVPSVVVAPLVEPGIVAVFTQPTVPIEASDVFGLWVMWCLAVVPSPPDWQQAWRAGDLDAYHAVWFGEHAGHAAAEGIA